MSAPAPMAPAVILGAGGHALVVLGALRALGWPVEGVCDPALAPGARWEGCRVLGGDGALEALAPGSVAVFNGIGPVHGRPLRAEAETRARALGHDLPALVHPSAWVDPGADLAPGAQVMAGAAVQPGARIGAGAVVNTRAGVDHGARVGAGAHVAPGATLCGDAEIGEGATLGPGAVVARGCRIGAGALVGAATPAVRDLPAGARLLGPAPLREDAP